MEIEEAEGVAEAEWGEGAGKAGVVEENEVEEEVGKTEVAGLSHNENVVVACGRSEGNAVPHLWVMKTHEPAS